MGEQKEGRKEERGNKKMEERGEIDYDPVTLQFIG